MGCFVVAEFLLTSASRGPSAIAEPLVEIYERADRQTDRLIAILCTPITGE